MAYCPLRVSENTPDSVRRYIHVALDAWFEEAHRLLSRDYNPQPATSQPLFRFTTALLLLEITGGISRVLYHHASDESGKRFLALLENYYPWDLEPRGSANKATGAKMLYTGLRNPLAHELGTPAINFGGLGIWAMSFSEDQLETLEKSRDRQPLADRTLNIHDGKPTLHIPGFYWGLRELIYRLTNDADMMTKVEASSARHRHMVRPTKLPNTRI